MTILASSFADAAECLAGSRWRKHGRNPASGLDCAGVPVAAAAAVGLNLRSTIDYDASMPSPELMWQFCIANGDVCGREEQGEGRVGLCRWGGSHDPRHLVVMLANRRIVHIDAGARRVVVVPSSWLDERLIAVVRLHGLEYGDPW